MDIQKTGFIVIAAALVILFGVLLKFYPDNFNWIFYLICFLIVALIVATIIVIYKNQDSEL
ncbi:hypothetical protein [Gramella sp. AN32]|uniref:Uncharacterized protein n=1 Tax=Christiangramia antarctica TaxID=2058158 RepID=A0ABW5X666_9FLAO|nr:hypothetical protein [Gramella sp. AN32]MCM4157699.1 hypothetical protein [Gramella sp. AN32]